MDYRSDITAIDDDQDRRVARLYRTQLGCFDSTAFDRLPPLDVGLVTAGATYEVIPLWAGARPGDMWVVDGESRLISDRVGRQHPAWEAYAERVRADAETPSEAEKWLMLHEVWAARTTGDFLPSRTG